MASERPLLERLKARDERAYEEVVRAHGGRLLAVTRRLLRNEEDARDAVQEAFLSAFRSIDSFGGEALFSTWLHRIAVNCALMKLRRRKRDAEVGLEDLLPRFSEDGHRAPPHGEWAEMEEHPLLAEERRALVRACIDRLPETYRTVLLLRDMEELDTSETAALLAVTENAVKIRLHRARQALRTLLDPHMRKGPAR